MNIRISEIIANYPKLEVWNTGGNCMALRLDLENGGYLLITNDHSGIPRDDDSIVWCGVYDNQGVEVGNVEEIELTSLSDWIQRTLDAGKNLPGSVREYFVSRLGQSLDLVSDMSKCPLESVVGDGCKKAIDGAAALIDALRVAWGERSVEAQVIRRIVADICNVFWRG